MAGASSRSSRLSRLSARSRRVRTLACISASASGPRARDFVAALSCSQEPLKLLWLPPGVELEALIPTAARGLPYAEELAHHHPALAGILAAAARNLVAGRDWRP